MTLTYAVSWNHEVRDSLFREQKLLTQKIVLCGPELTMREQAKFVHFREDPRSVGPKASNDFESNKM